MDSMYSLAREEDIDALIRLEKDFYVPLGLPPETRSGSLVFLKYGSIIVRRRRNMIEGAFWCIEIDQMNQIDHRHMASSSPFGVVMRKGVMRQDRYRGGYYIYGWASLGNHRGLLYRYMARMLRNTFGDRIFYGFVSVYDQTTTKKYLRMGARVIDQIEGLYGGEEIHNVLEYYP